MWVSTSHWASAGGPVLCPRDANPSCCLHQGSVPREAGWGSKHCPRTSSAWEPVRKAESRALLWASESVCLVTRSQQFVSISEGRGTGLGDPDLDHVVQMHCGGAGGQHASFSPLPHLRRGEGVQGAKETEAKPKLGA